MIVDWSRWRKCEVCGAGIGESCVTLSGCDAAGKVLVVAEQPHGSRKPRTARAPQNSATTPEGDA